MNFLADRTPRERQLIYVMLALAALMLGWMLLVRPLMSWHDTAEQNQNRAVRDYQIVEQGLPYLNQTRTDRAAFDRNAVIAVARQVDIPISRVQPENDGDLKIWFEDSSSEKIYRFLSALTDGYNASIAQVQMNRRPGERVSAQITLRPLS